MGRFVDDATLDDNVDSFLSHEEGDPRDAMGRGMEVGKGGQFLLFFFFSFNVLIHDVWHQRCITGALLIIYILQSFRAIGFTFKEYALIQASTSKVNCCHFSSDGKLLATGGHDKKVSDERPASVSPPPKKKLAVRFIRFVKTFCRLCCGSLILRNLSLLLRNILT